MLTRICCPGIFLYPVTAALISPSLPGALSCLLPQGTVSWEGQTCASRLGLEKGTEVSQPGRASSQGPPERAWTGGQRGSGQLPQRPLVAEGGSSPHLTPQTTHSTLDELGPSAASSPAAQLRNSQDESPEQGHSNRVGISVHCVPYHLTYLLLTLTLIFSLG